MVVKEESEVESVCESPQGGGSPASYSSSSPAKKEKVEIKEERDPKRQRITKGNEAE